MKKSSLLTFNNIRFRRWSRKNYAVFAGLSKVILIGQVCAGISDKAILKTNLLGFDASDFSENTLTFDSDDEEKEVQLFENFLQTNILILATDIPVGCSSQYFLNSKLEWSKTLCSNFFYFK